MASDPKTVECAWCLGLGVEDDGADEEVVCDRCGGTGKLDVFIIGTIFDDPRQHSRSWSFTVSSPQDTVTERYYSEGDAERERAAKIESLAGQGRVVYERGPVEATPLFRMLVSKKRGGRSSWADLT